MNPPPIIFGLEWECALGDRGVNRVDKALAYEALQQAICELSPWAVDLEKNTGIFTSGFRYYLDCGCHPEVAGVEVATPDQLLELKHAIFDLLGDAVQKARKRFPGLVLFVNNHDYLLDRNFWGCHESYSLRCPPERLARGMVPFLASRHLLAGNGRIDRLGRVLLSSRALALRRITEGETTSDRALYSTCRQEPLMDHGPFSHRLHLICGDACSLRGDHGEYLKVASTALVLLWLQEELSGANDLALRSPLRLLRAANVLWHPTGRLHVCPRARSLQHAYCDRVACFVERRPDLPQWCKDAVEIWRETLDLLDRDPLSLAGKLDPFTKLAFFDAALTQMQRSWTDIAKHPELYHELALVDLAFHEIGEGKSAARKPRSLEAIVGELPTRAAPRAQAIREGQGTRCSWQTVRRADSFADLRDPTTTTLEWKPSQNGAPAPPDRGLSNVLALYDRGDYEAAHNVLQSLQVQRLQMTPAQLREYRTYTAWVQSRRGFFDGIAALDERARSEPMSFDLIKDYVCAYRYLGLISPPAVDPWIKRGMEIVREQQTQNPGVAATFLDHVANDHMRHGRPVQALELLQQCLQLRDSAHPHVVSRILADLGDCHRMLGYPRKAQECLAEAEAIQILHSFEGDRNDFTLTIRAKVERDAEAAQTWLDHALTTQMRFHNFLGETRTLLLLARIRKNPSWDDDLRERVLELRAARPALNQCRRLAGILDSWKLWVSGEAGPDTGSDFFWGI